MFEPLNGFVEKQASTAVGSSHLKADRDGRCYILEQASMSAIQSVEKEDDAGFECRP